MHSGELCRRNTTDRAVRPDFVVVAPPSGDLVPCLRQRLEPLLGVWLQMEGQHPPEVTGNKKFEAWLEAGKYFETEAPKARSLLEDELRAILNPERAVDA